MKRGALFIVIILLLGGAAFAWTHHDVPSNIEYDFKDWPPEANEIKSQIQQINTVKDGKTVEVQREVLFSELFKNRFRTHTPMKAIGVKIEPGYKLKLMCPARMEPWEIDGVAMAAWKESQDDLGKPYEVDIFETYIGTAPIKIGELRTQPGDQKTVHIAYKYPDAPHSSAVNGSPATQPMPMK